MKQYVAEVFREIYELQKSALTVRQRYRLLFRLFGEALNMMTTDVGLTFSGLFARMDYLCRQHGFDEHYRQLNAFRARARELDDYGDDRLQSLWLHDVRVFCDFLAACAHMQIPSQLEALLPAAYEQAPLRSEKGHLRVVVQGLDEQYIYARGTNGDDEMRIAYAEENFLGDWTYVASLIGEGSQMNLVNAFERDGIWHAELFILEPDFLIDVSSVAACFEAYATSELVYLINRFKPSETTQAILLGNFAGQMLDEEITCRSIETISYADSVKRFFERNALNLLSCTDLTSTFHEEARLQQRNLRMMVRTTFLQDRTIDPDHALLEPSFLCEALGLQGRMDLLQDNMRVLMEQKSGKRDEWRNAHREKHYVQMLLYLAILHYGLGIDNRQIACYLLYSRYADGLLREGPAPHLLFQAIEMRNRMVRREYDIAIEGFPQLFCIQPEQLKTKDVSEKLWNVYIKPKLSALLEPMQQATSLEQAYFNRMLSFVQRERLLSKVGNSQKESSGFSAAWQSSLDEKEEAGSICHSLVIVEAEADIVKLKSERGTPLGEVLNFRKGDIVVLYEYVEGSVPDVRRGLVLRASISEMTTHELTLRLRAPQSNPYIFLPNDHKLWAVEHDLMEASSATIMRGMAAFLAMRNVERREILLAQRSPRIESDGVLKGDYGTANELVLRAKRARDFFLLLGPPGTGKTSLGMLSILRETLLEPQTSVLLTAYTNRAVEEMCSKLDECGIDFLRIGNEDACSAATHHHLLSRRVGMCKGLEDVAQLIATTRVFVGTTSSLSSALSLFDLKQFDMAIVDEASQILEPQLMGLLSAADGFGIKKFVFIGDHKQLPAVVQQTENESEVDIPLLRSIGLTNCRRSLFERLLGLLPEHSELVYLLDRQWRMHPDVASFPNGQFYGGKLRAGGAPHQMENLQRPHVRFVNVRPDANKWAVAEADRVLSDKVNPEEAQSIAREVASLWEPERFRTTFDPQRSLGIIVPYRNQIALVRRAIESLGLPGLDASLLTIDTVERYQGSERDVIIFGTTVRRAVQLRFLTGQVFTDSDGARIDRRLNVALTRARRLMIVVGNARLLSADPNYAKLIDHCRVNGDYAD